MIDTNKAKDTLINFLVPLVALLVSAAMGLFIIFPASQNIPQLQSQVKQKATLNVQLEKKLEKLNTLLDFKDIVDENSAIAEKVLVSKSAVPELLTQIDMISKESGLEVTKLSYSLSDVSGKSGDDKDAKAYDSVAVTLGVRGTFGQLKTFLKNLENSGRLVMVDTLRYNVDTTAKSSLLEVLVVLNSPFLSVSSGAVTDDVINLDITGSDFLSLMDTVKGLKIYNISPDKLIDVKAIEETTEATPAAR